MTKDRSTAGGALGDSAALAAIWREMDAVEWSADTLDAIAEVLIASGRPIRPPADDEDDDGREDITVDGVTVASVAHAEASRPIDYAEVRREFPKQKAALTRATKKGPDAVLVAVAAFFEYYESRGWSVPDDWHRWDIARRDAQTEIARRDYR